MQFLYDIFFFTRRPVPSATVSPSNTLFPCRLSDDLTRCPLIRFLRKNKTGPGSLPFCFRNFSLPLRGQRNRKLQVLLILFLTVVKSRRFQACLSPLFLVPRPFPPPFYSPFFSSWPPSIGGNCVQAFCVDSFQWPLRRHFPSHLFVELVNGNGFWMFLIRF